MEEIELKLHQVPLRDVRPTQMTVGMREVAAKRDTLRKLDPEQRTMRIAESFFPAVRGPKGAYFIIDRHHEARAIAEVDPNLQVRIGLVKDLSHLARPSFWVFMDHLAWVHCYDEKGRRRPFDEMPASITDLHDDPYRSLATEVRDRGGFAKPQEPFYEFLWANYFREQVATSKLRPWKNAVARAMKAAKSKDAECLPGWCGGR